MTTPTSTEGPTTTGKVFGQIAKIMAEVGHIGKDRKNSAQGYNFRGIDDCYNALHPILSKHGVFCVPEVQEQSREERQTKSGTTMIYTVLTVKFTFYADDGSSFSAITVGEASDSGDKSSNKAMSAAQKYAFMQVFAIPTQGDNDTENHSPEFAPRSKPVPQAAEADRNEHASSTSQTKKEASHLGSVQTTKTVAKVSAAGDYVCMFGKFYKHRIADIPLDQLASYADYLRKGVAQSESQGQGIREDVLEFIEAAEAFMSQGVDTREAGLR